MELLPIELIDMILNKSSYETIMTLRLTCKYMKRVCHERFIRDRVDWEIHQNLKLVYIFFMSMKYQGFDKQMVCTSIHKNIIELSQENKKVCLAIFNRGAIPESYNLESLQRELKSLKDNPLRPDQRFDNFYPNNNLLVNL